MFQAVSSPYLVPFDGLFDVASAVTRPPEDAPSKKHCEKELAGLIGRLSELQRRLYAQDRYAVLLVFQAMDAAGKDGTIRAVMSGVDPAGCQVHSFKAPSWEELDHDFLWRTTVRLPERGRIGIFNRSHYEEVLVVRVHPELLEKQRLPDAVAPEELWPQRLRAIADHERHLAESGTVVVKFWLHVSPEKQRKRFLARLEDPDKRWKFSPGDLDERDRWEDYQSAFGEALAATSKPWAPWYAVPADKKPFMRLTVARIVVETLESLHLTYPRGAELSAAEIEAVRARLDGKP
ncbi:MAG: polyphosphate kinase 2 family protein [Thermoanaerobaculia bacterium]